MRVRVAAHQSHNIERVESCQDVAASPFVRGGKIATLVYDVRGFAKAD